MYSGVCFGVQLGADSKGGPFTAAESSPVLSGVGQWSAGRLHRWTQVLKPLQDQALTMPDHPPLSRRRQARREGRSSPSRAVTLGHIHPPHCSVLRCIHSLAGLVPRDEKGKSISSKR